jgi:hypothetical protein
MNRRSGVLMVASAALLLPGAAAAQWGPDSLLNLEVCDQTGEQVTPKIVETSDGGCFISWFDSRGGGYALYLQRLDADGNELLGEDGLLVSDEPQQSWLVDYDMAVDSDDNAFIVFSDTRNTPDELDVSAYKISSDGTFLWGADGICLSDTSTVSFEAAPSVAVTPQGNSIVAWGSSGDDYTIILQKLSPDGDRLWGDWGITLDDPVRSLALPQLVPAGQDSAIVLFKSSTGSFPYQTTWLYAGLLDAAGDWAWDDTPILIYDSGHLSAWTNPEIKPDGEGGAICCWHDNIDLSTFEVWVQHVSADGDMMFPMNGAQASTNSTDRLHMYPTALYCPDEGKTYVFWVEENDNQSAYGIYGQTFSPTGDRQWGDSGLELVPIGSEQIGFINAFRDPGGLVVGYFIGAYSTAVRAIRTNCGGSVLWGPVTLSAASLGGKDDLVAAPGIGQGYVFAWCDNRNDYGIYAQRVNQDGSLGQAQGIGEGPVPAGQLAVYPNPSAGFSTISFAMTAAGPASLEVFDLSGRLVDTVFSGVLGQGEHTMTWAGSGGAAGIYFARLVTPGGETTVRLVRL